MGIEASVTGQPQITASVTDEKIAVSVGESQIAVSVGGGVGPTGGSGVVTVTAPITNSGTSQAANVGLAVGSGLSVSGGSLIVTPGTYATLIDGKVPTNQLPPIASSWNDLTDKPSTFPPSQHSASHAADGADPVTIAASQLSGGSLPSSAVLDFSNGTTDSEVGGWGFGVELTADNAQNTVVEYTGVTVHDASGSTVLGPGRLTLPNSTQVTVGSFDNSTGGANGISLICSVGYELNWQGGHLRSVQVGGDGTPQTIYSDSAIAFPGNGAANVKIDATGLTFADGSTQTVAAETPTITIGTVTSGSPASATLSGTAPNYTLDLTLQPGDTGPQGDQGPQGNSGTSLSVSAGPTSDSYTVSDSSGGSTVVYAPQGAQGPPGSPGMRYVGSADGRYPAYGDVVTYQGSAWVFQSESGGFGYGPPNPGWAILAQKGDAGSSSWNDLTDKPTLGTASSQDSSAFAAASHQHDDRYYTESEVDTLLAAKVGTSDASVTNAREWTADTISQAEAEAGTSTTRRAFTALRVFQAIAAWWDGSSAKAKLDGIASGATANQTDAHLLSRANHTGTQAASTISDFSTAASAAAPVQSVNGQTGAVTISTYTLPTASGSVLGGVKVGSGLSIDGSGVLSATYSYSLPIATASFLGGVKQGSNVTIAADGTISVASPVTTLPYSSITGTPTLSAVATSGSAADLTGTLSASRLTFATTAQAQDAGSTTVVMNPARATDNYAAHFFVDLGTRSLTSTGSGFSATFSNSGASTVYVGTTGASAGTVCIGSGCSWSTSAAGGSSSAIFWGRRIRFRVRGSVNWNQLTTNSVLRFLLGKTNQTVGALSMRGVGFEIRSGGALWLTTHNGSGRTDTNANTTIAVGANNEFVVESDGAGNATLWLNGTQVATSTGAPTTALTDGTISYMAAEFSTTDNNYVQFICDRWVTILRG